MAYFRGKTDANQKQIVQGLRKMGASVHSLHAVGDGCPDLLVGFRGKNYLLEVKDGSLAPSDRKLTPKQTTWHKTWVGSVHVILSLDEAINIITEKTNPCLVNTSDILDCSGRAHIVNYTGLRIYSTDKQGNPADRIL